jgi:hypothetical protein
MSFPRLKERAETGGMADSLDEAKAPRSVAARRQIPQCSSLSAAPSVVVSFEPSTEG